MVLVSSAFSFRLKKIIENKSSNHLSCMSGLIRCKDYVVSDRGGFTTLSQSSDKKIESENFRGIKLLADFSALI